MLARQPTSPAQLTCPASSSAWAKPVPGPLPRRIIPDMGGGVERARRPMSRQRGAARRARQPPGLLVLVHRPLVRRAPRAKTRSFLFVAFGLLPWAPRSSPSWRRACRGAGPQGTAALQSRGNRGARNSLPSSMTCASWSSASPPSASRTGKAAPGVRSASSRRCPGISPARRSSCSANREPYIHHRAKDGSIQSCTRRAAWSPRSSPCLRACSGVWVAHGSGSADRDSVDRHDQCACRPATNPTPAAGLADP